eukprot:366412-Chlamydomonas_euryale.AAC.20
MSTYSTSSVDGCTLQHHGVDEQGMPYMACLLEEVRLACCRCGSTACLLQVCQALGGRWACLACLPACMHADVRLRAVARCCMLLDVLACNRMLSVLLRAVACSRMLLDGPACCCMLLYAVACCCVLLRAVASKLVSTNMHACSQISMCTMFHAHKQAHNPPCTQTCM